MSETADTLDFGRRVRHAAAALEYLVLSLPLGIVCAVAAALLVLGAALGAVWVGLPIVLFAVAACARLAEMERRQANRLLDAHIAPLPRPRPSAPARCGDARSARSPTARAGATMALVAIKLPVARARARRRAVPDRRHRAGC